MNKGKDWESFLGYLSNYNASIRDWENLDIRKILESAITNKNNLPFKHHFRDFLIGIHCENLSLDLVTYNKKHFQWMKKVKIFTPDEFVLQLQNTL
jgi:predicted nucleic acid-binding protein